MQAFKRVSKSSPSEILVIKHGALGDIVLATGPFAAIRRYHSEDTITLLTTPPFASLLSGSPFFDDVWLDYRPQWWQLGDWVRLWRMFRSRPFSMVYDLQTSKRSSLYFKLFPTPKPNWSGIAEGVSHRHDTPHRRQLHTVERQKEQLAIAGIADVPPPDVSWLNASLEEFPLRSRFVLLVPGGSAHRPQKRWSVSGYIALANSLLAEGIQPVLLGAGAEEALLNAILLECPQALNLCNQTTYADIASLARKALGAVGNDTGPMHLIATAGCPSVVLFSNASDPALCAPRGPKVFVIQEPDLQQLRPERVQMALAELKPA